jgi:Winged helix-turn-helix domain (DUF2582)
MQAQIDSAAGTIWRYLNEHGEVALGKLKQGTEFHHREQERQRLPEGA